VTYDPDFPPPDRTAWIEAQAAAMWRDMVAARGLECLASLATVSPDGAAWAAYGHLQQAEAGLPYVSALEDTARQDARFWAETATPAELQAYALAALDRLAPAPFASRQIKRMIAALWSRMSPAEQEAFKKWIEK